MPAGTWWPLISSSNFEVRITMLAGGYNLNVSLITAPKYGNFLGSDNSDSNASAGIAAISSYTLCCTSGCDPNIAKVNASEALVVSWPAKRKRLASQANCSASNSSTPASAQASRIRATRFRRVLSEAAFPAPCAATAEASLTMRSDSDLISWRYGRPLRLVIQLDTLGGSKRRDKELTSSFRSSVYLVKAAAYLFPGAPSPFNPKPACPMASSATPSKHFTASTVSFCSYACCQFSAALFAISMNKGA
mmetsp:Transcript_140938/g.351420  ORF Transcript_140938/g.351420 Transcript_140938/m.351420 type:complete len:249 (+) Transcript_140938:530-1276(+)